MELKGTVMEVERKWVLKRVPELALSHEAWEINYAYTEDNERYQEVILLNEHPERRYHIVFKEGEGLTRRETTIPISEEDYIAKAMDPNTKKISKVRYMVPHTDGLIEIDDYKDLKLVTMEYEIEVATGNKLLDEIAEEFKTKDLNFPEEVEKCIIKEVTGVNEYANLNLAE